VTLLQQVSNHVTVSQERDPADSFASVISHLNTTSSKSAPPCVKLRFDAILCAIMRSKKLKMRSYALWCVDMRLNGILASRPEASKFGALKCME
jgi:hypothetical protein